MNQRDTEDCEQMPQNIDNVLKQLDNNNFIETEKIVAELAKRDEELHAQLLNRLKDEERLNVIAHVILVLGQAKYEPAMPLLLDYATNDKYRLTSLREHAVNALADLGKFEVVPKLIELYRDEKGRNELAAEDVREAVVYAVGKLSVAYLTEFFVEALQDEGSFVREAASEELANLCIKPMALLLQKLEQSEPVELNREITEVLRMIDEQ